MLLTLSRFFLSPVSLFLIGTLAAASPYFLTDYSFFRSYPLYEISPGWSIVYVIGVFAFILGAFLASINFRFRNQEYFIAIPQDKNLIIFWTLIFIQTLLLYLSVNLYGSVPLIEFATQSADVNEFNLLQKDSGGVLGILLIFQFILSAYIPIMTARSSQISKPLRLLFYSLFFFGLIFTGKRQMLFYVFFYLIGFFGLYYTIAGDYNALKKLLKRASIGFIFILLIFSTIAYLRLNEFNGVFYSLAHYLSLPFINNMHMYNLHGISHTRDFFSIIEIAVPTILRNLFEIEPVVTQPQLELSISGGLYGRTFWAYGLSGVTIYCFFLGAVMQTIYRLSFRFKFFCFLYPICIWPLLMVSTYDHFVNAMFFIIPILSFLFFRLIYTGFQRI